jgi:hypothetical protein
VTTLSQAAELRDALARVLRAREALDDGERSLAETILDGLVDDLWKSVARLERGATTR